MEGPDSGDVVVNTACKRETVGEVGDEQAYGGSIWLDGAEMIMVVELDESLCLSGVVPGRA